MGLRWQKLLKAAMLLASCMERGRNALT